MVDLFNLMHHLPMREVSGREDMEILIGMTEEITSGNATGTMTGRPQRSPREHPTLIQRRRILDSVRKVTLMKKRMTTTRDVVAKAVWNKLLLHAVVLVSSRCRRSPQLAAIRISPCCTTDLLFVGRPSFSSAPIIC